MRKLLWCTLILCFAAPARAFDGEREGFALGGGLGFATSNVRQDVDLVDLDSFTKAGLALDLRAGWGISPAIVLLASARTSWIAYDTQNRDGSDLLHGVVGLGMVQHLGRGRSDWYTTGSLGVAFFDLVEEGADALFGFGFTGGIGRTLRGPLGAELLLGWESTTGDIGPVEFGNSIFTLRLQLVAVAY